MNTYTALENNVINGFNIDANPYSFFDEGFVAYSSTWASCFIDECGDPKVYRGVVASLVKKGFFTSFKEDGDVALVLTKLAEDEIASRQAVAA